MYSGWYDKFSEMNAIVSPETNGYGVMKNKFALSGAISPKKSRI